MKKMNFHRLDYLTKAPYHYLPTLLNHYGKSPDELAKLQVADKPELLYTMLMAFHTEDPQSAKSVQIVRQLRHLKVDAKGGRAEAQRIFRVGQVDEALLKSFWRNLVDRAHVYRDDDLWVSEIVATFSYDPSDDYENELERWTQVSCPHCGSTNTVYDMESVEAPHDYDLPDFTHLTGPYFRCDACETVTRPEVSEATELPRGADYGDPDAWDYYVEWLDENLELMAKHVDRYGRPEQLFIGGRNLDWRGRDGYTTCAFEGEALARAMSVRGDFSIHDGRLWLRADGTAEMTCVMAHHDVPTGSHLVVQPAWECELDSECTVTMQEMRSNDIRCQVASTMLCGHHKVFPYAPHSTFKVVSLDGLIADLEDYLLPGLEADDWETLEGGEEPIDALASAIGRLLTDLIERLRTEQPIYMNHVNHLRGLIDIYLEHQ